MKGGGFGPIRSLTPQIGLKMFSHIDTPLLSNSSRINKAPLQPDVRMNKSAQGKTKDGDHCIDDQHASKVIIRLPKLKHLLGVSRSTVYLRLNTQSKYYDPLFPKPIRLGAKAVGWLLADVYAYIDHLRNADEVAI